MQVDSQVRVYPIFCFVAKKPVEVLFSLTCVVLVFVGVLLPVLGAPKMETDLSSDRYMKSDGLISDRHDALGAALDAEASRSSKKRLRRLSIRNSVEMYDELAEAQLEIAGDSKFGVNQSSGRMLSARRRRSRQARLRLAWNVNLYYRARGGRSVFDAKVLDDVRAFELKLVDLPELVYNSYCLSRWTSSCKNLRSATRFFYGKKRRWSWGSSAARKRIDMLIFPDGSLKERHPVQAVVNKLAEDKVWDGTEGSHARASWYFDANFPDSKIMRASAWFGTRAWEGSRQYQEQKYTEFVANHLLPMLQEASTENVEILYMGNVLTDHEVFLAVQQDTYYSIGSLIFVWIYMSFHLRQPLLALLGMGIVALSFPMGLVFFRILGNDQMAIVNYLSLFLLIGIGADNIFVLTDLWTQARNKTDSIAEQLQYSMTKAGKAVSVCGITTACSFLANSASAVRPVREFGTFVGLCVISNLLLCLTLYPPILVLFERIRGKCSGFFQSRQSSPAARGVPITPSQVTKSRIPLGPDDNAISADAGFYQSECFLYNKFAPTVMRLRFCVIASFVGLTIICMFLTASSLTVSREPPEFFAPGEHNLGEVFDLRQYFGNESFWVPAMEKDPLMICKGCPFDEQSSSSQSACRFVGANCDTLPCQMENASTRCAGRGECNMETGLCTCSGNWAGPNCTSPRYLSQLSDCSSESCPRRTAEAEKAQVPAAELPESMVAMVSIVFGINPDEPIDRSKTSGDSLEKGAPRYDDAFDFNDPSTQLALWQLCNASIEDPMWANKTLAVRKPRCLMNDFNLYLNDTGQGGNVPGLPVEGKAWGTAGKLLSKFLSNLKGKKWKNYAGFDEKNSHRVRWFRAEFVTNLPFKMPAADVWPWMERWDHHLDEWNSGKLAVLLNSSYVENIPAPGGATRSFQSDIWFQSGMAKLAVPSGLRNAFHTSALWVRAETEIRLVKSTLTCAVISICCALIAILVFTGNLALAIYLVFVITCIVICLAGMMFGCFGWSFGAVEAIGLIVFVGFSVDYSLHLVEAYNQSAHDGRFARTREALLQTGAALFSAAVTSIGAGMFILFCTIKVFVKFGVVIIANTILSLLFSLFFLCALLMVIGPIDNFGSVPALIQWLCGKTVEEKKLSENVVAGQVLGMQSVDPGAPNQPGAPSGYQWRQYDEDPEVQKQKSKSTDPAQDASTTAATVVVVPVTPRGSAAAQDASSVRQE